MKTLSATIRGRLEQANAGIGTLTLPQIDTVFDWAGAVDGPVLARLLIGQIASDDSEDLLKRCASAILATHIPETLLGEIVTLVPACRASLTVAAEIMHTLRPDHPLASRDLSATMPFAVYDALDDGKDLFVTTARIGRDLTAGATGLILGTEAPLEQVASFRVARKVDNGTYLEICEEALWLERQHVACPPFIVIL